ncbi:MAG: hypothetical protein ACOYYS_04190 [Chloroflexota bacterium]
MKTVRASEIGTYLYCQRAWSYQRQGVESQNQAELVSGTQFHETHGRAVVAGGCLRTLAYIFLLAALILGTVSFVQFAL